MNRVRNVLAQRYARAFLQVFKDTVKAEQLSVIKEACAFLKERADKLFLMELSFVPEEKKQKLLYGFCDRMKLPAQCKKLCWLLLKEHRASLLPDVLHALVELREKELSITHFKVSSSSELSEAQKSQIIHFLDTRVHGSIDCVYEVDTTLIAGIRLQSRSLLWEKSIKKRLRALQESLR